MPVTATQNIKEMEIFNTMEFDIEEIDKMNRNSK